jgi:hypothetical protein
MKKPTNRFKQTIAGLMAAMAMVGAPTTEARTVEVNSANEVTNPNKNAVVTPKEKGQGIKVNNDTGGLGFDMVRMSQPPNPIYIPYYHPKQTYRAQVRKSKKNK